MKAQERVKDINRIGRRNVTGVLNFFTLPQEVRLAQDLARTSDTNVPLAIKVLRDETVDEFALPGGFFLVNSGLMLTARDEAKLTGVMGHEIAHIAGRLSVRQASRGMLASFTVRFMLEAFGGEEKGHSDRPDSGYDQAAIDLPQVLGGERRKGTSLGYDTSSGRGTTRWRW